MEIYTCKGCKYNLEDIKFTIGRNTVNIYYCNFRCNLVDSYNELIYNKIILFLKDAIINYDKILFLWIDNFDLESSYELIEYLLYFENDIHILTN